MSLTLENLGRRINRKWIIRNLNLEVKDGECLALLGPSGCGKSSTLRLIAGLDKPTQGEIYINEKLVTGISAVNRSVGMVFQSYALFPHLNINDNLSLGLKIRRLTQQERNYRVKTILELMHLEDYASRFPAQLSGGQKQRVALARLLLRDPSVYLLDEPMSNLDAQLREDLRPELRKLIFNTGRPVVYVTHDQHEAMAMANRIAVLRNGVLEQIGTPEELYRKPISIFVASFIGRPQINLINQSPKVIKGVRPEDIFFSTEGIDSKLMYKEWLGNNQLIFLKTNNGMVRMLCPSDEEIPSNTKINWLSEKEHIFDKNTEKRISN